MNTSGIEDEINRYLCNKAFDLSSLDTYQRVKKLYDAAKYKFSFQCYSRAIVFTWQTDI